MTQQLARVAAGTRIEIVEGDYILSGAQNGRFMSLGAYVSRAGSPLDHFIETQPPQGQMTCEEGLM